MPDYQEKKKNLQARLELLKNDAARVEHKIKQTLASLAECDRMLLQEQQKQAQKPPAE
jgi:hypothetical protein